MYKPFIALSMLSLVASAHAGDRRVGNCDAANPATCYPGECRPCFCLGPDNYQGNAPVNPRTCNGDLSITAAIFYWKAQQDGMEYAIKTNVPAPNFTVYDGSSAALQQYQELNNIIDGDYKTPNYSKDVGFKFGVGYASPCDGWDISLLWTSFQNKAKDLIQGEPDDNQTLLTLWSSFSPVIGLMDFAREIRTSWNVRLNLLDLELGRKYWISPVVTLRPHIGLRYSEINQDFEIGHTGGSWGFFDGNESDADANQPALNGEVDIDNDFHGIGVRGGIDSVWNFGCGWGIYGNLAASIIYGRFDLDHNENNRLAESPFSKIKVLETEESFKASRAILDLALGIQWAALICDCTYGITVSLGWEQHLFFHQNQMWRVSRIGDTLIAGAGVTLPNNTGENVFQQRRGNLDTSGWTFTFKFDF